MAKSLWVLNWLHLYPLSLICIHCPCGPYMSNEHEGLEHVLRSTGTINGTACLTDLLDSFPGSSPPLCDVLYSQLQKLGEEPWNKATGVPQLQE